MEQYPEHKRLAAVRDQSQPQGELLEWAQGQGLVTLHTSIKDILAQFHGIDQDKIDAEKKQMLDEIRNAYRILNHDGSN